MIYIIWAPPRKGKTYYATWWALRVLKAIKKHKGNKKRVFSNYPIYSSKWGSSLYLDRDTIQYDITDSLLIYDEAYRDFNSRKFYEFSKREHTFFATNGHDNNDIVLIAHGINRLDSVIREMVDTYFFVKKYGLPFSDKPILFNIEGYIDLQDIAQRYRRNTVYSSFWLRFSKEVGKAYDTHFFRKPDNPNIEFISWFDMNEEMKEKNLKFVQDKKIDEILEREDIDKDDIVAYETILTKEGIIHAI